MIHSVNHPHTIDMRIGNPTYTPRAISDAHLLILQNPEMQGLAPTIAASSELHTIINLDNDPLAHQPHRIGSLFATAQPEEFKPIAEEHLSLKLFIRDHANDFETAILTLFHQSMLEHTQNLTGNIYDQHVETIQNLLDESNTLASSSITQVHHFECLVDKMAESPLKTYLKVRVLPCFETKS